MSEGTVRDVTINLKLIGDARNSSVTSKMEKDVLGAYGRMKDAGTKTATAVADATEKAKAKESKAAEKAAADQERTDNRVSQNRIKLLAQIAQNDARNAQEAEKNRQREEKAAERSAKTQEREYKRAEAAVDRLGNKVFNLGQRQERMSLGMVHGAGHLAHALTDVASGLTIIGGLSEKNSEKLIRTFAAAEGIGRALHGTISILTSIVHLSSLYERSLHAAALESKALGALDAARATVAAAPGAIGVAGNVAGGAAGQVAGSVAGGAVRRFAGDAAGSALGVGAAAGTGWFARNMPSFAASGLTTLALRLGGSAWGGLSSLVGGMGIPGLVGAGGGIASAVATGAVPGAILGEGLSKLTGGEGTFHALGLYGGNGWWQASKAAEKSEDSFKAADEAYKAKVEAYNAREANLEKGHELQKSWTGTRRMVAGFQGAAAERRFDQNELTEARAGVNLADRQAANAHRSGIKESMAEQLSSLDRLAEAEKNILETRKKSVETLTAQKEQARELRKQGVEILANANAQVEAEKRKLESRGASLEKLDPAKRQAVLDIGDQLSKGGKLNEVSAKILDETGFGSKLTRQFYWDKLNRDNPNARKSLKALGEEDGLRDAQDDREDALDKLNEAREQEEEITDKLTAAKQKELDAVNALAEVVQRIVELNNRRDGLNVTIPSAPKAVAPTGQKTASNDNTSGDIVAALDGANADITNSTDQSIDAVNKLAHHVTKQNERLTASLHRNAALFQMNTV